MSTAPVGIDSVVDEPPVPELGRPVPVKLSMEGAIMMPRIITTRRSEINEKPVHRGHVVGTGCHGPASLVVVNRTFVYLAVEQC